MTDESTRELSQKPVAVIQRNRRAKMKADGFKYFEMWLPRSHDARIRRIIKMLMPDSDGESDFLDCIEKMSAIIDAGRYAEVCKKESGYKCRRVRKPFPFGV